MLAVAAASLAFVSSASASSGELGGPALSAPPTVTGTPTQGARLRAEPGSWTGSGKVRLAYQWFRCDTMGSHCDRLRGATTRTRLLGGRDVGHTVGLQVRAIDSHGSSAAYASLVGPVAGTPTRISSKTQPVVSGAPIPGSTLHVVPGVWKPKPASFSFQWVRCGAHGRVCAPIAGANSDEYAVQPADAGHALIAIVQARAGAVSRAVFSVAAPAAAPNDESAGPANSTPPSVGDVLQQGSPLIGNAGSWSSSGKIAYA